MDNVARKLEQDNIIGTNFKGYRFVDCIRERPFAKAYKANHVDFEHDVAVIIVFNPILSEYPVFISDIVKEVKRDEIFRIEGTLKFSEGKAEIRSICLVLDNMTDEALDRFLEKSEAHISEFGNIECNPSMSICSPLFGSDTIVSPVISRGPEHLSREALLPSNMPERIGMSLNKKTRSLFFIIPAIVLIAGMIPLYNHYKTSRTVRSLSAAREYMEMQDYRAGVEIYKRAAERGSAEAQNMLGLIYGGGMGVEKDVQRAFYWYQKAAESGIAESQYNLGMIYFKGETGVPDFEKALYWYQKAAEQGNAKAQFNLGYMHDSGKGVKMDLDKAFYWYQKAADRGFAPAQLNLGNLFVEGAGTVKSDERALFWYKKAADQGVVKAASNVGIMHMRGTGTERNYDKAFYWFQKAAEGEDAVSEYFLGVMYLNGLGVTYDETKGKEWLRKAAGHGDMKAKALLKSLGQ
ncbi:MAG: sel1 repeat family protein [Oligoflexales bacterium]|nr:sel1 repeat family protein [Oligoflexales bacterium]